MNTSLELYKIFYNVAKYGGMTKASQELYISQPAISQSIKKLEGQLGATLFLRSNKGMELTQEGKMFYEYIKGALELINNAENEFTNFKELSKGEINIGCSTTLTKIILLDTIVKFRKDYPNIKINILNELTSNLILDLQKGKLDFVIFNESDKKENNVTLEVIRELKYGFVYNPNYYNINKIIDVKDINSYPLILQKKESNSRQFLDAFFLSYGVKLLPKTEAVSQDLINEFANIGLGIGFTIMDLANKYNPDLKELKLNKEMPNMRVYIATNKSINLTFAANKFIKYLKEKSN